MTVQVRSRHGKLHTKALPDSGATKLVLSLDLAKRINLTPKLKANSLYAADNRKLACEGRAMVKVDGIKVQILVSSSLNNELILSWHDLIRLGVLPADFPNKIATVARISDSMDSLDAIKRDFGDVLTDKLPAKPIKGEPMTIQLDTSKNCRPVVTSTCK